MPKLRILVVDDEPQVRTFVKICLSATQFDVAEAGDGLDAIDLLSVSADPFDLVITDLKMPRMDGIALAHWVRTALPSLPVLLISGYAASADFFESGPHRAFLQKPFLPAALNHKIGALLAHTLRPDTTAG